MILTQRLVFSLLIFAVPCLCEEPLTILDFDTACQRVLTHSLILKSSEVEVCAKQSETEQVSLRPNPFFSFSADCIGQPHASRKCEEEEFTFSLSQIFELGGKRSARQRVASSEECIALCNQEIVKLDILSRLLNTYIDTASAQCLLKLIEDQKKDADETLRCICAKQANGKVAPIEEKKAKIACHTFELTLRKTQTQFEVAKRNLAMLWGSPCPDFEAVSFSLYEIAPPPSLELLEAYFLANNPELAKSQAEIHQACEIQKYERTLRIPDVSLSAGVTAYWEECPTTFSVGFNVPIPLFNQNQGNISRSNFKRIQAEYQNLDIEQNLMSKLKTIYVTWQTAFFEAKTLQEQILPAAIETFQMARDSYKEGKFEYLDLLDARKTLFDVNFQYLETVTRYQHIKADMERLIASPIESMTEQETCESP